MPELRVKHVEWIDLKHRDVCESLTCVGNHPWMEEWITDKLVKAGFNLDRLIRRRDSDVTNEVFFWQDERVNG